MSDDLITIETPEHIHVQYELAGIGSRALAGLLDLLLQGLITAAIVLSLTWLNTMLQWRDAQGLVGAIIIGSVGFLAATAYYVISEMTMDGQSPGKRMAGLRVVRDDGTPITFLDSAIRNILRAVDMIPFFYTVGLLTVFFSKHCKRLGDLAAGTIVVKERMLEQPQGDLGADLPPTPLSPEAEARLRGAMHLLAPADFETTDRFLTRRYELDPATRARLGNQLATALLAKLASIPAGDYPHPEALLEAVARLRRERPL